MGDIIQHEYPASSSNTDCLFKLSLNKIPKGCNYYNKITIQRTNNPEGVILLESLYYSIQSNKYFSL